MFLSFPNFSTVKKPPMTNCGLLIQTVATAVMGKRKAARTPESSSMGKYLSVCIASPPTHNSVFRLGVQEVQIL